MTKSSYVTTNDFEYNDSDQDGGKAAYTLANLPATMRDSAVFDLVYRHTQGTFSPEGTFCQCAGDCCGRWYKNPAKVVRDQYGKPVQVTQRHWVNI